MVIYSVPVNHVQSGKVGKSIAAAAAAVRFFRFKEQALKKVPLFKALFLKMITESSIWNIVGNGSKV